ncbi:Outer membrane protein oprM precursor [Candidatus Ornithobacterium hominis]|uniref:TolC family protein n=1 Tax=Candidatus Ornithobacterium hominis TaxID=2497989 RepID=UPI000E5ACCDF|nr:TolC family protein [Candidatus Ornithobacterium hominis]SZD71852.1 Outer membrane protein oprM precursor [Candidatus Ornithobacterium hominis]
MRKTLKIVFLLIFSVHFAQEKPLRFSLQEAIDYTLTHNYDLLIAANNIEKAQKKIWENTAIGLPQINGNVDYNYNINRPLIFLGDTLKFEAGQQKTLSANVQASQLLFSGSYLVGLQSAKAFKQISVMSKEKAESELKQAVINAYAAVIIAGENLKILEKNVKTGEKNLHDIKEIYKAGLGEEQAVDQMSYNLLSLKSAKDYATRQKENALNSLKFIMGLNQNKAAVLTTSLEEIIQEDLIEIHENKDFNLKNHIDYRLAKHQVTLNELQVKHQKSMALPTLSTFLQHSHNWSTNDASLFNKFENHYPSTIWGLRLEVPIFSSLQRRAKTQQAKIELENAEIERIKTEQKLIQEVKNAYLNYENALERYQINRQRVELTRKIFGKEQIKYFEGLSSNMDLTNTEFQMYEAENEYISSALELITSKTALYQALGKY